MTTTLAPKQTLTQKKELVHLVRAAQRGERCAFEELFQRYRRAVHATVLRRLDNHAEAEELVQEVFLQAMRKIGQITNPLCFGGWLRSIANRMAINRAVRGGHWVAVAEEQLSARCVERRTPLGQVLEHERLDQLRLGLKRLTDLDRRTLEAFYFRGQSLIEMSGEFRSPVGTIKRRLHVARKRLAKQLGEFAVA